MPPIFELPKSCTINYSGYDVYKIVKGLENMNKFNAVTFSVLFGLSVVGCASTSNSVPVYPVLNVASEKTYVWDNSISEALNVAKMAQPAGVGVGMEDFADGTKANTGRVGAGEQLFDSALGLASMGGFGVLSMGVLNSEVNSMVDWKPSVVFLIPVDELTNAGKFDLKKTQVAVEKKLANSLKQSVKDLEWFGVYTSKTGDVSNATYAFNTSECHNALKPYYVNEANAPKKAINSDKLFFESTTFNEFCAIRLKLQIAGFSEDNGVKKAIVVGEFSDGHYFLNALRQNIDGYMIFPESFAIPTVDSRGGRRIGYKYAFVVKNGTELMFQK